MDLVKAVLAEPDLERRLQSLSRHPDTDFPLLTAKIKLTWNCNLRCIACTIWKKGREKNIAALPEPAVMRAISALADKGLRKIHFSGGEVLTYPGFREVVQFARARDLQVNFTTNGILFDKDMARFVIQERVHSVSFSVDGATAKQHDETRGLKGAWKITWKGIKTLREKIAEKGRGPHVRINTVITRYNIESLEAMFQQLRENGIKSWRLLPIDTPDKKLRPSEEQWKVFASQLDSWKPLAEAFPIYLNSRCRDQDFRRIRLGRYAGNFYQDALCFAPWFNLFIDADGAVFPCCMSKGHIRPIGNILESDLGGILQSPARNEICCSFAAGHPFEICHSCDDFLEENQGLSAIARHDQ